MNNTTVTLRMHITIALLLSLAGLLALPAPGHAAQELVPVAGINYNVNATLPNNLRLLKGKRINVTLDSGKSMTGQVKDVGDKLLHLAKIEGREFFDALIRIESINSIDTRFRTFKR